MTSYALHGFLFVPATRLERVSKAVNSGADAVIIDLEDAVAGEDKAIIREHLHDFLMHWDWQGFSRLWLRINGTQTEAFAQDIQLIHDIPQLAGVALPKVNDKAMVEQLTTLTDKPVIAMIESATGVLNIGSIAGAKGVFALSYGCLDLLTSLGITPHTHAADVMMDKIRTELVLHSSHHGLHPPIETIFPDFDNPEQFLAFANHAQAFGFGGQLLIHPKQVATLKQLLTNPKSLAFAKKVVEIYESTHQAVFAVDGQMVDMPVILWAKGVVD